MSANYLPQKFIECSRREPPEVLYHYTAQNGLLGIVEKAELWATKVQYMNDATEFGVSLDLARQRLESLLEETCKDASARSFKTAYAELLRSLTGLEQINIFASCFCEDGDLLSQWRGYSSSGGVAIGFDTRALTKVASEAGFILGKCVYELDIQRVIVNEAIEYCCQEDLAGRAQWGRHGPLAEILFRCGAFFKDSSFSEEKEWRLVSPTVDFWHERLRFRPGRSMLTPYYAVPVAEGEAPLVRHIVVGPCPHMELAKSAVEALLMKHGLRGPLQGHRVALGSSVPFRNW
jgi:hypothetical protein